MKMKLSKLANGAVDERINAEIEKIAQNILDPNTDSKKVRKMTLTISIKPDVKREFGEVNIETKSTLAPVIGIPTKFMFGTSQDGKVVAKELMSEVKNQLMIDNDGDVADDTGEKINAKSLKDNVVNFK